MSKGDVVVERIGPRLLPQRRLEVLERRGRVVRLEGDAAETEVSRSRGSGQCEGALIVAASLFIPSQLKMHTAEADRGRGVVGTERPGQVIGLDRFLELSQVLRGAAEQIAPAEVPGLQLRGVGEAGSRGRQEVVDEVELASVAEQEPQLLGRGAGRRPPGERLLEQPLLLVDLVAYGLVDSAQVDFGHRDQRGRCGLCVEIGGERHQERDDQRAVTEADWPRHGASSSRSSRRSPVPRTRGV